jgi:predicted lipid-binding transport protein (Tim44 family)
MLGTVIDWICWFSALAAIAAYVAALLRNRPYLRPLNSLGLLLVGGALLGLPTVLGPAIAPQHTAIVIYIVGLLVASVGFQIVSAFRRRSARAPAASSVEGSDAQA